MSRIKQPSILCDIILERIYGPGKQLGGWDEAYSGSLPWDFEPDAYFEEVKTAHLPPIFTTKLQNLSRRTGLPFYEQWAYEWERLRERLGTRYTKYPYYFDGFGEVRSGVVGQYLQRQAEVFRSAFIRTLAAAIAEWGMPVRNAEQEVFEHIPAVAGLFDVDPIARPDWLGEFPALSVSKEADLERLLKDFVVLTRGQEERCVSLTSPLPFEEARYGDIYIGAFFVSDDFELREDVGLYEPMDLLVVEERLDIRGPLPKSPLSDDLQDGAPGSAAPICVGLFPVPHGYWQADWFGITIPIVADFCAPSGRSVQISGDTLEVVSNDKRLSRTYFWHDHWSPRYPRGGTTRCGAAAEVNKDVVDEAAKLVEGRKLAWYMRVRVWERESSYGDFALRERRILLRDDEVR
ncbi:hypothetical protein [Phyllobacterium sp. 22552]|uniref:hypothetical protein n=1 Tax=Phyllobacterium sp. 22552 TaxID=3453941 RepID=UPI003F8377F8